MTIASQTEISVEHVDINTLRPDPANPRRISDAELEALTRSIREFGLVDPIIARHDDRIVIGGHQRLLAARKLGLKTVPVIFIDLPPEKAHLLNLALNRISGTWDQELLARLLLDLPRRKTRRPRNASPQAEEIAEAVGTHLREGIQLRWQELRSIELVLEEIAGQFDVETPTRSWEREALDDAKKKLEELHLAVQAYVGPFKLPGPDEEEMEQVRELIRREGDPWGELN
jgi:hypothetical protein